MKKIPESAKEKVMKTDQITCVKEFGLDGLITCYYKGYASEIHMNPVDIRLSNVDCKTYPDHDAQCTLRAPRPFVAGQRYSKDFDYCGMLQAGKEAKLSDGVRNLNKLFDSYEDVNYHVESEPLIEAIRLMDKGKRKLAENKLKDFNKLCEKRIKAWC